jgi:hypothetical protein
MVEKDFEKLLKKDLRIIFDMYKTGILYVDVMENEELEYEIATAIGEQLTIAISSLAREYGLDADSILSEIQDNL